MDAAATIVHPAVPPPGRRQRLAGATARAGLLPLLRVARGMLRRDLRILAYHRIATRVDPARFDFDLELLSADAEGFRAQVRHLRDHYEPLRLGDVAALRDAGRALPRRAVVVTFDDGYDDNHDLALPILREFGVPATFFVSTGHVDSGATYAFDWAAHAVLRAPDGALRVPALGFEAVLDGDRAARRGVVARILERVKALAGAQQEAALAQLRQACGVAPAGADPDSRPMRWDQVRALHAAGMEIGSHGTHHRMLAKLDDDGIRAELAQSRDAIARELGVAPVSLAYPVGGRDAFDDRVVRIARELGYRIACSYLPGVNPARGEDWFALRRIAVERDTGPEMFAARLALPEVFGDRERGTRV
jgi:peptidoglycan/xylan/chitin deacetylase (PgdA/CDA1 family)